VTQLREKLTGIANEGNEEIRKELESNDKPETKVTKIAQVIADCQRQANQAAADCAFSIVGEGQKVVDAQGSGGSFFGMTRDAGIDTNQQPNLQAIEDQVRGRLNPAAPQGTPAGTGGGARAVEATPSGPTSPTAAGNPPTTQGASGVTPTPAAPAALGNPSTAQGASGITPTPPVPAPATIRQFCK
jgi:hypothetical protein